MRGCDIEESRSNIVAWSGLDPRSITLRWASRRLWVVIPALVREGTQPSIAQLRLHQFYLFLIFVAFEGPVFARCDVGRKSDVFGRWGWRRLGIYADSVALAYRGWRRGRRCGELGTTLVGRHDGCGGLTAEFGG